MFTTEEMVQGIEDWMYESTGDPEDLLDLFVFAHNNTLDIQDIIIRCMSKDYDDSVISEVDEKEFLDLWLQMVRTKLVEMMEN